MFSFSHSCIALGLRDNPEERKVTGKRQGRGGRKWWSGSEAIWPSKRDSRIDIIKKGSTFLLPSWYHVVRTHELSFTIKGIQLVGTRRCPGAPLASPSRESRRGREWGSQHLSFSSDSCNIPLPPATGRDCFQVYRRQCQTVSVLFALFLQATFPSVFSPHPVCWFIRASKLIWIFHRNHVAFFPLRIRAQEAGLCIMKMDISPFPWRDMGLCDQRQSECSCPSQSPILNPTSTMMVLAGGAFGRWLRLNEVMRVGPSRMNLSPL